MSRTPSGGWREVYRWCSVPLPMTSRSAATASEASSGAQHKLPMSERQNQSDQKEVERYAKQKLREIARDLESAQGAATIPQLVDEIRQAGAELAHVRNQIKIKQSDEEIEA